MPSIDLSILNQRQTPAFYADTLANRPAAGFVGRIFVSTNTFAFFRDNGTGWDLIGGPGTGTVTGSGAAGQVSFWNGASSITGSNDLFWDSVNGHLGIGTNVPGTALQIDHDQNQFIRLNQTTATNDTKIAFQNSGIALWRIGNSYNAGANDFGIYDVVGSIQPVTVKKTTGQVLIGTSTVGSGKLVVASATSDNGIQIVGAAAPSLRIDSAESGPTKRIGIGLATAVNNFIQNSQNLDMCIFNGSTSAAGNMLFGIYDTGLANIQEAARISSARNFLIGTITDTGQKLQVRGNTVITNDGNSIIALRINDTNANSSFLSFNASNVDSAIIAGGTSAIPLDFYTNGLVRLRIASAGNVGIGNTGNSSYRLLVSGNNASVDTNGQNTIFLSAGTSVSYIDTSFIGGGSYVPMAFGTGGSERMRLTSSGNLLIGTTTDAGEKLQVAGTARIQNTVRLNASSTVSVSTSATIISSASNTYGGLAIVWGSDAGGNIWTNLIFYSLGVVSVLSSQDVSGGPDGRTYSVDGSGNLRLAMAAGTYNVRYQALLTS